MATKQTQHPAVPLPPPQKAAYTDLDQLSVASFADFKPEVLMASTGGKQLLAVLHGNGPHRPFALAFRVYHEGWMHPPVAELAQAVEQYNQLTAYPAGEQVGTSEENSYREDGHRMRDEVEYELQTLRSRELRAAQNYYEAKLQQLHHPAPWYDHAAAEALETYFRTKARRQTLEWVLGEPVKHTQSSPEPPRPEGWEAKVERMGGLSSRGGAVVESYQPWRQLVFAYNTHVEQVDQAPLTRRQFYDLCRRNRDFQLRWTPYKDLDNTPYGAIMQYELEEG